MILLEDVIGSLLVLIGLFFMIVGSFGLLLLPDFFARTHAASKVDTVGIVVALIGISFLGQGWVEADKALLAAFLIMLTNPVSAHALAKAAYRAGHKPWTKDSPEQASESKTKQAD